MQRNSVFYSNAVSATRNRFFPTVMLNSSFNGVRSEL